MLLPSAISCESSHPPLTRLHAALFASPPASPPQLSAQTAFGNLFTSCRSLQSLMTSSAPMPIPAASQSLTPPTSSHAQLPTPPMGHTPSPMKLRLRSRRSDLSTTEQRKKVVKRSMAPRGANKRRRAANDDMGREDNDDDIESDLEISPEDSALDVTDDTTQDALPPRPQTPKRARIAPEVIPLGLERSDYHTLHADGSLFSEENSREYDDADVVVEGDGETWSTEEDRMLVELVLEKLKLSKSDWQDCARSLGKDRGSLGRRWKSLMIAGDVGLKRSSRRGRLHSTWR